MKKVENEPVLVRAYRIENELSDMIDDLTNLLPLFNVGASVTEDEFTQWEVRLHIYKMKSRELDSIMESLFTGELTEDEFRLKLETLRVYLRMFTKETIAGLDELYKRIQRADCVINQLYAITLLRFLEDDENRFDFKQVMKLAHSPAPYFVSWIDNSNVRCFVPCDSKVEALTFIMSRNDLNHSNLYHRYI